MFNIYQRNNILYMIHHKKYFSNLKAPKAVKIPHEKKLAGLKRMRWMFRKKGKKNGASERIRTVDSHVGNVILYQLSYTRSLRYN